MKEIENAAKELASLVSRIQSVDDKIDALNNVRKILHEVSPLKNHPCDCVQWVKSDSVEGNEYNPNSVAPPEMKLLIKSITEDGYTMPIVGFECEEKIKIVDGFHRRKSERTSKEISDSVFGRVPVAFIRQSKKGLSDRMASTIRHNRARGTHNIDLMSQIVSELTEAGMGDDWIMKHVGMDADELLRLKQITGLAALFKDRDFSMSWSTENKTNKE